MSPELYERIISACRAHQARGGRVTAGFWGIVNEAETRYVKLGDVCCAIGTVLAGTPVMTGNKILDAAALLGCDRYEIADFIEGFDGAVEEPRVDQAWQAAGKRMRKELGL